MFIAAWRDLNFVHHRSRLPLQSSVRVRQQAIQSRSQRCIAGGKPGLAGGERLWIGAKNFWCFSGGFRGADFASEICTTKTGDPVRAQKMAVLREEISLA